MDDEFLLGRILFLITYETTVDLEKLLGDYKLESSIEAVWRSPGPGLRPPSLTATGSFTTCQCPQNTRTSTIHGRHGARRNTEARLQRLSLSPKQKAAVQRVCHYSKAKMHIFANCHRIVPHLFAILKLRQLAQFPLQSPVTLLINALINMDLSGIRDDASEPLANLARLVEILDKSTDPVFTKLGAKSTESFDENGAPLIALLRKIVGSSTDESKKYLKSRLLPSEK